MSDTGMIEDADRRVAGAAAPLGETKLVWALGKASELADQPQLIGLCAAVTGAGLLSRRPPLARTGARMLAAELIATAIKTAIKRKIDRTRPEAEQREGYRMTAGHSDRSAFNSFPSGHTAGAVAVARMVAHDHPRHRAAAALVALAVAAVQIPRSKHYPSDLLAGAAIGLLAAQLVRWGEAGAVRSVRTAG